MAELTKLETKLGEVIGLAMAAQTATQQVLKMVEEEGSDELAATLQTMAEDAAQAERRGTDLLATFEDKKTAILDEARSVKTKAAEMMSTYLDDDADALDGFEFLTMAEAGETGHWQVLGTMNQKAGNPQIEELVQYVTPIQERHFQRALEGSLQLAGEEDPNEPA